VSDSTGSHSEVSVARSPKIEPVGDNRFNTLYKKQTGLLSPLPGIQTDHPKVTGNRFTGDRFIGTPIIVATESGQPIAARHPIPSPDHLLVPVLLSGISMDGGIPMEPTDAHLSLALTDDQIERIAAGLIEQHGPSLSRTQFNDAALGVFENVPGLEAISEREVSRLLATVWRVYGELAMRRSST